MNKVLLQTLTLSVMAAAFTARSESVHFTTNSEPVQSVDLSLDPKGYQVSFEEKAFGILNKKHSFSIPEQDLKLKIWKSKKNAKGFDTAYLPGLLTACSGATLFVYSCALAAACPQIGIPLAVGSAAITMYPFYRVAHMVDRTQMAQSIFQYECGGFNASSTKRRTIKLTDKEMKYLKDGLLAIKDISISDADRKNYRESLEGQEPERKPTNKTIGHRYSEENEEELE